MKYTEYSICLNPINPWQDILIAYLSEENFDTFLENPEGFSAFIPSEKDSEECLKNIIDTLISKDVKISYTKNTLDDINWNHEWEKNFEPIIVEDTVYLKADFHPNRPEIPYQINVQPKMSFGTGHHETTYLMLKLMIDIDFKNKNVLDMGCGTSVLAMFAKLKSANRVLAIDNDKWAYENSIENKERNNLDFEVLLGDSSLLGKEKFDVVLANINKNILIQDMSSYVDSLNKDGYLLMSGIYHFDFDDILEEAESLNLKFLEKEIKNDWIAVKFQK